MKDIEKMEVYTEKILEKAIKRHLKFRLIKKMYNNGLSNGSDVLSLVIVPDYRKGTPNRLDAICNYEYRNDENVISLANEFIRKGIKPKLFMKSEDKSRIIRYLMSTDYRKDILNIIAKSKVIKSLINSLQESGLKIKNHGIKYNEFIIDILVD